MTPPQRVTRKSIILATLAEAMEPYNSQLVWANANARAEALPDSVRPESPISKAQVDKTIYQLRFDRRMASNRAAQVQARLANGKHSISLS